MSNKETVFASAAKKAKLNAGDSNWIVLEEILGDKEEAFAKAQADFWESLAQMLQVADAIETRQRIYRD